LFQINVSTKSSAEFANKVAAMIKNNISKMTKQEAQKPESFPLFVDNTKETQ
jgi:hypothetical protein